MTEPAGFPWTDEERKELAAAFGGRIPVPPLPPAPQEIMDGYARWWREEYAPWLAKQEGVGWIRMPSEPSAK
jgi:hypothetical protein